jgi:uncharacterized 2Fe-2S/4Fe-4S cluster protein (DUF4445 family)
MPSAVTVTWAGGSVRVEPGTLLSSALNSRGMVVETPCGGRGYCLKCLVRVTSGAAPPSSDDLERLSPDQIAAGYRLACRLPVTSDLCVSVKLLPRAAGKASSEMHWRTSVEVDIQPWFTGGFTGTGPACARLRAGFALDLGTTTLAGALVDLTSGEQLASGSCPNPQAVHGADVMSRLAYAIKSKDNARALQALVLEAAEGLLKSLCAGARITPGDVLFGVAVGNTAMHHLALGLDVTGLSRAPYCPALREGTVVSLSGLPPLYAVPVIAGFAGSDAVADAIAAGLAGLSEATPEAGGESLLLIDVGTNSEVLLSHGGTLYVSSSPAGPAFEGGEISQGMLAGPGAIDSVRFDSAALTVTTVGGAPPRGICGSGLVDAAAALLEAGVLDEGGRMQARGPLAWTVHPGRVRSGRDRPGGVPPDGGLVGGVFANPDADGMSVDIAPGVAVTQKDIRALQLAKGAIRAAIEALLAEAGATYDDLREIVLAGTFGTFLSPESAVAIGLLPPVELRRIRPVGNAALAGAKMILLSRKAKQDAERAAASAVHVELALRPDFQEVFLEAVQFRMPQGSRQP